MSRIYFLLSLYLAAVGGFIVLATHGQHTEAHGKILRLAIDTEPKTLDPIGITDTISDGVGHKVYNMLVRFDKKGEQLVVAPELAESWTITENGTVYTFVLRKGVRFHNGRELKASDVVYSLMRLLSPRSKRSELIQPMVAGSEEYYKAPEGEPKPPVGIEATGEYEVRIRLNAPFAPFIQHLCTINCAIVPREAVEDLAHTFARNPVGTGPFKLKAWIVYQQLLFERNDDYFKGKPKLDMLRFAIIKDKNIQLEQFMAGDLDASGIPFGQVKSATEKAGKENVLSYSNVRTNYLGIGMPTGKFAGNPSLGPFGTNKLLRQAINYALDREYLCNVVLEGRGVPAKSVLPPGMPGYKERPGWPKNVEKAKALLKEAGYPDGKGLPTITILHRNDEDTKRMAQSLLHDLDAVGIPAELQARDWNNFLDVVEKEPQPMFLLGWVADYPDPDNFLFVLFHSSQVGSPGNNTFYSNPEVDALTAKARTLTDMNERVPLYNKAEDIILDECPWICTYHARNLVLLRKEVLGIRENVTAFDTGTEFPQVDFSLVDVQRP